MPFVLPHQGRREGERAAAEVREGEKGRWRRRKQIEEKGRRRGGGEVRRGEGVYLIIRLPALYSMLEYRSTQWSCTWLICS